MTDANLMELSGRTLSIDEKLEAANEGYVVEFTPEEAAQLGGACDDDSMSLRESLEGNADLRETVNAKRQEESQ